MTPEELQKNWQSLSSTSSSTASEGRADGRTEPADRIVERILNSRVTSARERLISRYRMSMMSIIPLGLLSNISLAKYLDTFGLLLAIGFFLLAGAMDYYLYRGLRRMDLSETGVEEVAEKARFYRKRHLQFQLILIPLAIAVLMCYFEAFAGDTGVIYAMIISGVIGLSVGLWLWIQFMRDYKSMTR